MAKKRKHLFSIPIGDWSGDGHNQVENFTASADKPISAVREAYFEAQTLFPSLNPETFWTVDCGDELPEEIRGEMIAVGFEPGECFYPVDMARFVVWLLNRADPELHVVREPYK